MFRVLTNKSIALDSPDHIDPLGCKQDNFTNKNFNARLYEILNKPKAFIMDLGCAGGGFINDCVNDGYLAVGLEGSDEPIKRNFGHWAELYGKNLFNCDVTEPYQVLFNDIPIKFDCITAWELMEHFLVNDVDTVINNIKENLADDAFFICSVYVATPAHAQMTWQNEWGFGGNQLFHHRNIETPKWWDEKFISHRFTVRKDLKDSFNGQFVRGPGFGAHPDRSEERLYIAPVWHQAASINRVYQYQ